MCSTRSSRSSRWKSSLPPPANASATTTVRCWASAVALFCVWFCNGLWHGAAWSYLFFGMYHFVLILGGNIIAPPVRAVNARLHIRAESFPYRLLQMLRTTVLVIIGELFFRANGPARRYADVPHHGHRICIPRL